MYFTAPSVAVLALAAGVSAGVAQKEHEPPVHGKSVINKQATGTATAHRTGIQTGTHPIMTGTPNNGTQGNNGTAIVTSTAPCFTCQTGSSTIPVVVPSRTPAASSGAPGAGPSAGPGAGPSGGAGGAGGAGTTPAGPGATGFTPSNPGSKVSVPQVGAAGAVMVYGLMLLA
ncbi:hypothetical protein N7522_005131 [Penicillium canescens]|uniref:Uncharacterized protein n=1 Tax=Penicillium canescens TaxID=5083 RepID=A0AAD6I9A9_PENCN|nr:uncharacterized protein N7446_005170 [Penicillium canescens]KAJ6010115.1 hypothetical protein N7522_005131 [Penicillium canescens]KAJ6038366.1 hypothetical protein N7460_008137 [Penicillium canescens]KAJ6068133.1 hypothetical protein N7446_005170 [Penicillium canescens]